MKKSILIISGLLIPVMGLANEPIEPQYETGVYALKISPNGKWVGSMAGDASIYNMETGENIYHSPTALGLGNSVANNGMAVGCVNDVATIMYKGETFYPKSLAGPKYWFCDINGITSDASYIVGTINNPERSETLYVPFIATIDENGEVGEPRILPFPKEDFFRAAPQFVTGVWISNDAKTVVGQVQDWRGMYSYPIYFKEDENGEWSYTLPSEPLFNPTGLELPDNPWLSEPAFPEPENFMSGNRKEAYLEAYEAYSAGLGGYPVAEEYMTEEEYEEFANAVTKYNEWYYGQEEKIREYVRIYSEVLKTSPTFSSNDMTMHPSGDYFMMVGGVEGPDDEIIEAFYKFNTKDDQYVIYQDIPKGGFFPHQILSDGTLIITKGLRAVPTSYIMLPDSEDFITLQEYLAASYPEVSDWLDKKVPGGTGVVSFSDDMKVITGALVPDQLSDYNWDNSNFYYSTYFIKLPESAGIDSIEIASENETYKVYNLNGVKVLETKDQTQLESLGKGLYIINGKKVILQ